MDQTLTEEQRTSILIMTMTDERDALQAENERLRAALAGLAEKAQCPWCLNLTVYPHGPYCEIAKLLGLPQETFGRSNCH